MYCFVFRGDNKKKWGFETSPSGEELSITERRVLYLVNKYLKKGNREPSKYHHLFHDNLYSSKKYFETLWTRCRIYATGIIRKNKVPIKARFEEVTKKDELEKVADKALKLAYSRDSPVLMIGAHGPTKPYHFCSTYYREAEVHLYFICVCKSIFQKQKGSSTLTTYYSVHTD